MNKKILIIISLIIVIIGIGTAFILSENNQEVDKNVTNNNTSNNTLNDTINNTEITKQTHEKKPVTYCDECGSALYNSNMCEPCNAKARQKYYDAVANGEDTSFSEPKPIDEIEY